MQLDACIMSIKAHYPWFPIIVLYKATSDFYEAGYIRCQQLHPDIDFMKETDFKKQTIFFLGMFVTVTFMTDDDLFYKETPKPKVSPMTTISHRLGEHTKNKNHFNYTISLDGNIYMCRDLIPLIEEIDCYNPNDLEARLVQHHGRFTMETPGQFLVNLPHNRVSDSSGCRHTNDFTTEYLNALFLEGVRIDQTQMDFTNISGPHMYNIPYKFLQE